MVVEQGIQTELKVVTHLLEIKLLSVVEKVQMVSIVTMVVPVGLVEVLVTLIQPVDQHHQKILHKVLPVVRVVLIVLNIRVEVAVEKVVPGVLEVQAQIPELVDWVYQKQ